MSQPSTSLPLLYESEGALVPSTTREPKPPLWGRRLALWGEKTEKLLSGMAEVLELGESEIVVSALQLYALLFVRKGEGGGQLAESDTGHVLRSMSRRTGISVEMLVAVASQALIVGVARAHNGQDGSALEQPLLDLFTRCQTENVSAAEVIGDGIAETLSECSQ